jgi:ABC-type molybdate transport system substrate-binding protein
MKRFISISVVLMLMVIVIGCFATMSEEQRKETYDLRQNVGDSHFVGATSPDSRAMNVQMRGF